MKKALLAIAIATVFIGCATRTEYVTTALPCPGKPELPTISAEGLQSLSDETYSKIVTRDRRLREYAEQLLAVCESTHDNVPGATNGGG